MTKEFAVINTAGTITTVETSSLVKAVAAVRDIVESELEEGWTVKTARQNTRHVYPIVVDVNVYDEAGQLVDDATVSVRRNIDVRYVPFATIDAE